MSERFRLEETKAAKPVLNAKQALARLRSNKKSHLGNSRWLKGRLEIF